MISCSIEMEYFFEYFIKISNDDVDVFSFRTWASLTIN